MDFSIRKFEEQDRNEILNMMKVFYSSDAVSTNGSLEIFTQSFELCVNQSPYLEGYVFEKGNDILGYSLIAKSFSTEFGKYCIWFEDLYLKPEYRGNKIIPKFIEYIEKQYSNAIFKLEVEDYNKHAVHVYKKMGFEQMPYIEMKKGS